MGNMCAATTEGQRCAVLQAASTCWCTRIRNLMCPAHGALQGGTLQPLRL